MGEQENVLSIPIETLEGEEMVKYYNDMMSRLDSLMLVREEKDYILISDRKINAMVMLILDEKKNITMIRRF